MLTNFLCLPTFHHKLIDSSRASRWGRQTNFGINKLYDLDDKINNIGIRLLYMLFYTSCTINKKSCSYGIVEYCKNQPPD